MERRKPGRATRDDLDYTPTEHVLTAEAYLNNWGEVTVGSERPRELSRLRMSGAAFSPLSRDFLAMAACEL